MIIVVIGFGFLFGSTCARQGYLLAVLPVVALRSFYAHEPRLVLKGQCFWGRSRIVIENHEHVGSAPIEPLSDPRQIKHSDPID